MKRFIIILILGSFLFNITGSFLLFAVLKFKHTLGVADKIDADGFEQEGIITLVIPVNDPTLKFIGNDEFIYASLLYDVIEMREHNGYYSINAFMDIHEKELTDHLIEHTKRSQKQDAGSQSTLSIKSLLKDFTSHNFNPEFYSEKEQKINAVYTEKIYQAPGGNIFAPPPEA